MIDDGHNNDPGEESSGGNYNVPPSHRLARRAYRLANLIDITWSSYRELFDNMDLDSEEETSLAGDILVELEANLVDILDQIRGQAYILVGVYEPLPKTPVKDFESSVLRDLAGLDTVNLEDYRQPMYDNDYEEDHDE